MPPSQDPFAASASTRLLLDRDLPFLGSDGRRGFCRLRAFAGPLGLLAILTELARNPGMSITEAAEGVVAAGAVALGQDPDAVMWVEHYDRGSYHQGALNVPEGSRYTRIRIDEDGQAVWEPVPRELLESMIGQSL
jgi:hypothetical protein